MQWEIVLEESSNENCSEKLMKLSRGMSVTEPLFVVAAELKLKNHSASRKKCVANYLRRKADGNPWFLVFFSNISSVIMQKGDSQNGCFKKTKHAKFSKKHTSAYQGVRNVCFSKNMTCFVFLKHPFWYSPFCFISDDLDNLWQKSCLYVSKKGNLKYSLTLSVSIPDDETKTNFDFYFHTFLWCLKSFYEGLSGLHKAFEGLSKPFEAPQRSVKIKF